MGELTVSQGNGTAIRCLSAMLAKAIPAWVDLAELDASGQYGYGLAVPDGRATELLAAAEAHRNALAPVSRDEADRIIRGLRSATILQAETAAEAEANVKLLRVHLADVPADILEAGCRAYCNAPGRRFFPRSAGELRTFIDPLVHQRQARAWRLRRLAEQAFAEQAERERLAADPLTPEAIAEIKAEFSLGRPIALSSAPPVAEPEPGIGAYLAIGLSEPEARQALADRKRLLARAPSKTIGAALSSVPPAGEAQTARAA